MTKMEFYKCEHKVVQFMCEFLGVITVYYCVLLCITYYRHVTSCRGYVYPVVKLIKRVICLFICKCK